MIRPALLAAADELRSTFQAARPFRHLVLEEFLVPEQCRRLAEDFPTFDAQLAVSETGEAGTKAVFQNLPQLGAAYSEFDAVLQSTEFLAWLSHITSIPDLIYDPDYIGGGTHENLSGQDLDVHVDFNYHPARRLHRRLNLILFLNAEWRPEWGGILELHLDPWSRGGDEVRYVAPWMNYCVIFETTERSWHGFRTVEAPEGVSRRSIAVYFYSKERPQEEIEAPHATIYAPWPLAERFAAGYTLNEGDVAEVRWLLRRRDDLLRFLYDRELEFSRAAHSATIQKDEQTQKRVEGPAQWLARPARAVRRLLLGGGQRS